jgi:hypothetical protein
VFKINFLISTFGSTMSFPETKAAMLSPHQQMSADQLMSHFPPEHLKVPGQAFCLYVQLTTKDAKYPTLQTNLVPLWMPIAMFPTREECKLHAKRIQAAGWDAFSMYIVPVFSWHLFSGFDPLKPEQREWAQKEMKSIFGQFSKDMRDSIEDIEARMGDGRPIETKTREQIEAEVSQEVELQIRAEIEKRLTRGSVEELKDDSEPKRKKRVAKPVPVGAKTSTPMAFSVGAPVSELPAGATCLNMSD